MLKMTHEKLGANVHKVNLNPGYYLLFSYETLVAFACGGIVYEDSTNYSRTTNKHKTQYLLLLRHEVVPLEPKQLQQKVLNYMVDLQLRQLGELL